MKNRKTTLLLVLTLLVTAILLAACSSPEPTQAPPPAAPTEAPVDILPTASSGEAMLTAKQNLYVRSGPSQQYPVYLAMSGGETAKLVGVSEDGTFYAIEVPLVSPNTGWVNAELADVTGAEGLPVMPAPQFPPRRTLSARNPATPP